MLIALCLTLQEPHADAMLAAAKRSDALETALRGTVRAAVQRGASGDPLDDARARAALAEIDAAYRIPEYRQTLLLGSSATRRFVLSELAAWRDRSLVRPVVSVAVTAARRDDRDAAREALRAIDDPDTAKHLIPDLTDTTSTLRQERAIELAAEFGDGRLTTHLQPMLQMAASSLKDLETRRAAGGPAAVAASEEFHRELSRRVVLLEAAVKHCEANP